MLSGNDEEKKIKGSTTTRISVKIGNQLEIKKNNCQKRRSQKWNTYSVKPYFGSAAEKSKIVESSNNPALGQCSCL